MSENQDETILELCDKLRKPVPMIDGSKNKLNLEEIERQRRRAADVISDLQTKLSVMTYSSGPRTCIHGVSVNQVCPICGTQHKFTTTQQYVPQLNPPSGSLLGCVCPPGANKDCENGLCPRRGYSMLASSR